MCSLSIQGSSHASTILLPTRAYSMNLEWVHEAKQNIRAYYMWHAFHCSMRYSKIVTPIKIRLLRYTVPS